MEQNDTLSEQLTEVVNENAERAMFLREKVMERLEDFDLDGAKDLISHYSEKNNTYWEMAIREMRGDVPDVVPCAIDAINGIFPTKEQLREERNDEQYADDAKRDKEKELEKARI